MSAARQEVTAYEETRAPVPIQSEAGALVSMIERAARDPNVDIDKMERLLQMQERVLARTAREAFNVAFAEMQSDLPEIREKGRGDKNTTFALWEDVNEAIKPILKGHGFGLSFKTGRTNERIIVTAILLHRAGHSEETTLELPVDTSGSKNAVQAVGSSTSYGKRYTAMALLNLTSRLKADRDDDGRGAGAPTVSEEQIADLTDLIESVGANLSRFLNFMGVGSLAEIPAARFDHAVRELKKKERR